ncbi:unnamed protein product [marine sediment metagenome]|uniref:Uncharacterized protein n=1 Tax=marine sediment metagenome TaxID=412755 RepID=X1AHC4_9ZZZZ
MAGNTIKILIGSKGSGMNIYSLALVEEYRKYIKEHKLGRIPTTNPLSDNTQSKSSYTP